ncbi:hypothetical protein K2173_004300 [Erythroxylum novogranatense]|uniref:SWIM-type domain-containing protein n=1 Tax=Erythroxylum novogranatense TaxID=1862640 RepID=A0AAV8U2N1_9ROSI|nr:hypothetical protein K2173_004300 [Erythroxylum novogranatense]
MCHPGFPSISDNYDSPPVNPGWWLMLQRATLWRDNQDADDGVSGGRGDGACEKKMCICSPTNHPGSFKCKHHRREYKWIAHRQINPT